MCGFYEINNNNRANATHGLSPVKKMFPDRTEVMLDRRGTGPGTGPVLTLVKSLPNTTTATVVATTATATTTTTVLTETNAVTVYQRTAVLGRLFAPLHLCLQAV